jgi:hypothetical protein
VAAGSNVDSSHTIEPARARRVKRPAMGKRVNEH